MKWTLLVNHSPYERTTPRLRQQRKKRLEKIEQEFLKYHFLNAPRRLHEMSELDQNIIERYDLGDYTRGERSFMSVDTIVPKPELELDLEESVEEESVKTISSEESYFDDYDQWRKEEKKNELFTYSLSIDEEAEDVWGEDESMESTKQSEIEKEEETVSDVSSVDLIVHATSTVGLSIEETEPKSNWDYKMCKKFLSKTDDEIRQNWVKEKKKSKPVNVVDTDEALVEKIAEELCDWASDQGLHSSVLTVENISDLFRFKFTDNVVVESMMINVKQRQNIPNKIVKNNPSESTRAELYRQIMLDKIAYDRPNQNTMMLSQGLKRKRRIKQDPIREWIEADNIPQDLLTTKSFFENLLESDILEKFVIWLVENPESYRPKFLREIGFIDYVIEKNGGVEKIRERKEARVNRERFRASQFISKENAFLNMIKRLDEIRSVIHANYEGSVTSF